jgi:hypothetical protein
MFQQFDFVQQAQWYTAPVHARNAAGTLKLPNNWHHTTKLFTKKCCCDCEEEAVIK